ncbi:hypothetical protein [Arenicella xantha]|uniref:Uncharacterized protein n=1 Tax=Arenicella xantha TaxID=644221 RepID=A0A395JLN5_9GAMM|nr:hypothetical protein [Arenicella xantha]RBP51335.1 hypothetical protein DFR28_102755 [Arenicella xantha]
MANELFRFMLVEARTLKPKKPGSDKPDVVEDQIEAIGDRHNIAPRDFVTMVMSLGGATVEAEVRRDLLEPIATPTDPSSSQQSLVSIFGVGKAYVTRETLLGYEKEEYAFIENVLRGEEKVRSHRRTDRTEVIESTSSTIETSQSRDLQTHQAAELARETSEQVEKEAALQAGVKVSADYGTTKVDAMTSGSAGISTQASQTVASRFSKSVVTKAVNKMQESRSETKVVKSVTELDELSLHSFKNAASGAKNIAGVYRSLMRKVKVEVMEVGQRMMLEFVVPQPAASLIRKRVESPGITKPEAISLSLEDVLKSETSIAEWARRYTIEASKVSATDVVAPPQSGVSQSNTFILKPEDSQAGSREPLVLGDESGELLIEVPEGYQPSHAQLTVLFPDIDENDGGDNEKRYNFWINIGEARVSLSNKKKFIDNNGQRTVEERNGRFYVAGLEVPADLDANQNPVAPTVDSKIRKLNATQIGNMTTAIPIAATAFSRHAISATVTVYFEPTKSAMRQWAYQSYSEILEAYQAQMADYQNELDRLELDSEEPRQRVNSLKNRDTERRELKRACLSMLMQSARLDDPAGSTMIDSEGDVNFADTATLNNFSTRVRAFETAFEWENMTYIFYPYFWADKENWLEIRSASSMDATFEHFLTAGAARVFVPVRPGYSQQVAEQILGGESFDEFDVTENRDLLEILELDKDRQDEVLVDCFEELVPTNLVVLDDDNPDINDLLLGRTGCAKLSEPDPEKPEPPTKPEKPVKDKMAKSKK